MMSQNGRMMSQSRRSCVSPRHKLHLPNISFGISPASDVREKTQGPFGKSPRDYVLKRHTCKNPKVSPRNSDIFPPHSPSPPQRQAKTWIMNDDRRWPAEGNSPNGGPENRETGLYNPLLNDMFVLLAQRENSLALPPQDSPRGGHLQGMDQDKVREKQYVLQDLHKQPIVSRFERDELYIPSVYSKYFACRECRTAYVAKMFTKQYIRRNHRYPQCFKTSNVEKERRHFCDVLGKRFCASCMERENRKFSRSLEQLQQNSNRGTPQVTPQKSPLKSPKYTNHGASQQLLNGITHKTQPVLPREISLTDLTHQSHSDKKPKKVIGIDLRFATM